MLELNKIHNIKCLDGLKQMGNNSVQFVFADPPYNLGKDYIVYKDNLPMDEYFSWMNEVINECRRISNNNIAFYVSHKILREIWNLIPDGRLIIIHRRAIGGYNKNYFNMIFGMIVTKKPIKRDLDLWNDVRLTSEGFYCREKRYPHPHRTSNQLVKKVLKVYTSEGDLVVDPFMGTGTTAVECKRMKRNFIGFEINPEYCKIAEKRLSETYISYSPTEDWF